MTAPPVLGAVKGWPRSGLTSPQDREAFYDERAGIAEFDHHLPRAEAERLAVAQLYDELMAHPPRGILQELAAADRVRHSPLLAVVLEALGLGGVCAPTWGVGHVVFDDDGVIYRPARDDETAHAALIVPACDRGAVVDLAACAIGKPRRMGSRLGIADLVGADEVERSRGADVPLLVFDDLARWLRGYMRGVVLINWPPAIGVIEGIKTLVCSADLAPRLHDATRRCWPRPTIAIARPEMRHAA